MNKNFFTGVFAVLFATALVVPTVLFSMPQRASAAGESCIAGLLGGATGGAAAAALSVPVNSGVEDVTTSGTEASTFMTCLNQLVLLPAAQAEIKMLLQSMTANVISFINGNNGTGQPSFVPNLSVNLQAVGDAVAGPFIGQIASGVFNSPFGDEIASSLQQNYAQQTSLSGFYQGNQCTLGQSSPDINSYLAGNWSQGGVGSWFTLTTEAQNNPYMLNQSAQNQLGNLVSQAQANRQQDLLQSGGFLSWCGGGTSNNPPAGGGWSPGATCINADGSSGNVETPGSVIAGYAQKAAVDAGFDQEYAQLISANEIDQALGSIVGALISQALGGVNGLLGVSQSPSPGRPTLLTQLNEYQPTGTTANTQASSMAQTILTNITGYTNALETIANAADTASTSAAHLASTCTAAAAAANAATANNTTTTSSASLPTAATNNTTTTSSASLAAFAASATAEAAAAQAAINNEINPVLTQTLTAISSVAPTQALALKVETEAGNSSGSATLGTDAQTLGEMPPSASDISNAQQNAQATGNAVALPRPVYPNTTPTVSLTVTGGTLVDQMNLISQNANTLASSPVCTMPALPNPNG